MNPLYATVEQIKAFAPDFGLAEWAYLSGAGEEPARILKRVAALATEDVERALGVPRPGPNTLPGAGDQYLRAAALYQAIAIIPTLEMDELRARVAAVTDGSYSDGILSIGGAAGERALHPIAKSMLQKYQSTAGGGYGAANPLEFCRG